MLRKVVSCIHLHKNGFGLKTLPQQEIKSPHSLCWAYQKLSFVSGAMSTLLSLFKVCVPPGTWPTLLLYVTVGWGQGSFHCSTRGVLVRDTGHGGPTHTPEADLALSFLCVRKVLFHPMLDSVVKLSDSYFKMQRTRSVQSSSLGLAALHRTLLPWD